MTTTATITNVKPTAAPASAVASSLARLAGLLYLVITGAAILAHIYVPEQLAALGDSITGAGAAAAGSLLRTALGGELVVLLSEVVLSIVLYILFAPVSRALSLTAMVFRLVMTTVHGLNLLNYFFALRALGGAGEMAAFSVEQRAALSRLFLDAHSYGFTLGIVFLVPHVFVLGYLIYRSGYVPRALGVLFLLAACGYLFDSLSLLFVPGYAATPAIVATVIAGAEIAFPLWLLARGVSAAGWARRSQPAA